MNQGHTGISKIKKKYLMAQTPPKKNGDFLPQNKSYFEGAKNIKNVNLRASITCVMISILSNLIWKNFEISDFGNFLISEKLIYIF